MHGRHGFTTLWVLFIEFNLQLCVFEMATWDIVEALGAHLKSDDYLYTRLCPTYLLKKTSLNLHCLIICPVEINHTLSFNQNHRCKPTESGIDNKCIFCIQICNLSLEQLWSTLIILCSFCYWQYRNIGIKINGQIKLNKCINYAMDWCKLQMTKSQTHTIWNDCIFYVEFRYTVDEYFPWFLTR